MTEFFIGLLPTIASKKESLKYFSSIFHFLNELLTSLKFLPPSTIFLRAFFSVFSPFCHKTKKPALKKVLSEVIDHNCSHNEGTVWQAFAETDQNVST